MITAIEEMTHPLGIRFYKILCDDFITGRIRQLRGCVMVHVSDVASVRAMCPYI